ncbi:uncharacterized protein EKO05_0005671 [Ascochyta rabiei]|uniref:uncharacterized protein n=1 Tax=Didymella rabiei TaxID=5454 RepID=UPI0019019873|nr:uncharacterized protein EKO05_0005671 [Ascochyta rabiei]UPX15214.1 hypothetical protein EKO05_0005671 [Ascochyta rabiei]
MFDQLPDVQLPSDKTAKDQPSDLGGLSLKFLNNLKTRFGEQSPQSLNVHETLGAFKRGELGKREVHKAILDTLEGHDDLRQGLMDILLHPEAKWTPGDFHLPNEQQMRPILEPTPQFLQPTHQLQMRLPSFSSRWFPLPQVDRTASLGMFGVCNGHSNGDSPPTLPVLAHSQLPETVSNLWTDHSVEAMHTIIGHDEVMPPPIRTAFRNPWEDSSYNEDWANDGLNFLADVTYIDEHYTENMKSPLMHLQEAEFSFKPSYSKQEPPQHLHSPWLTYDLLPPPTDHYLSRSVPEEQHTGNNHVPPTSVSVSPPSAQKTEEYTEEFGEDIMRDRSQSLGGPFIHALCGKGFAAPSRVKKHHWGKKHNNLATTTGCWAKHKKPDVAWDDHPSCQDGRSTSETTKLVALSFSRRIRSKAAIPEPKTPAALDTSQQNTIPGFPTLDYLPHTVARALNTGTATVHSPQELEPGCHAQISPRSSFDGPLTVVNVVSQIDAPQPQSRTNSIALHLDAQVAATERHAQHTIFVPFKALTSSSDPRFVCPVVPTVLDTITPSMEVPSTPGMGSRLKHESDRRSSVRSSDVEEFHTAAACSWPFEPTGTHSSGPTRKKRKV